MTLIQDATPPHSTPMSSTYQEEKLKQKAKEDKQ
jgi:hypothetical protein